MNSLSPLSHLQNHEKWVVSAGQIHHAQKTRGRLKNLLDFNQVVQFSSQQMRGKTQQEVKGYFDHLSLKYTHIKQAIDRQNLISRLFIKVVLWFYRFDTHFNQLKTTFNALERETPQAIKPYTFSLKGGFVNGGNTCFFATALQCLNAMQESLPKDLERDLTKRAEESEVEFIARKQAAQDIYKLLEKSNRSETCTGEEIQQVRQLVHQYDNSVPAPPAPGPAKMTFQTLLTLFLTPRLRDLTYDPVDDEHSPKQELNRYIEFTIWDEEPPKTCFGQAYTTLPDGTCQLSQWGCADPSTPPLFIPICIGSISHAPLIIPDQVALEHSSAKYELVSCGISGRGHDYSYTKVNAEQWVKYDDHAIGYCSAAEAREDIASYGAILIYRRC